MFFDVFFFFKQKTAYEMRISDWSSDVCSSDLPSSDAACRAVSSSEAIIPAERDGAATPSEVEEIVGRPLGVARVADILFVEQILHREADTAEIGLITDDGVGERVAPEIVARIGTVETARQIELRLDARRQRAERIAGGEVQPVG